MYIIAKSMGGVYLATDGSWLSKTAAKKALYKVAVFETKLSANGIMERLLHDRYSIIGSATLLKQLGFKNRKGLLSVNENAVKTGVAAFSLTAETKNPLCKEASRPQTYIEAASEFIQMMHRIKILTADVQEKASENQSEIDKLLDVELHRIEGCKIGTVNGFNKDNALNEIILLQTLRKKRREIKDDAELARTMSFILEPSMKSNLDSVQRRLNLIAAAEFRDGDKPKKETK